MSEEKKPYPLALFPEEHAAAKKLSAEARVSMGAWIRHLIRREAGLPTLGAEQASAGGLWGSS